MQVTIPEIVKMLFEKFLWPKPTDLTIGTQTVHATIGARRYIISNDLHVLETDETSVFASNHSAWHEAVLRGMKRDAEGNMS